LLQFSVPFLLFRVPTLQFPPLKKSPLGAPFSGGSTYQGFGRLRGIMKKRPLVVRVPNAPLRSALRFSQPLDGFLRFATLQVCFTPQPRARFSRSGVSLSEQYVSLIERRCPHAVGTFQTRRPKSAAIFEVLDFEAFPRSEKRVESLGLTALSLAPLFGFASPPGDSLLSHWTPVYPKSSAHGVVDWRLRADSNRSPSAYSLREAQLVCLQTADLPETFKPSV
jgi:hypothetical protein